MFYCRYCCCYFSGLLLALLLLQLLLLLFRLLLVEAVVELFPFYSYAKTINVTPVIWTYHRICGSSSCYTNRLFFLCKCVISFFSIQIYRKYPKNVTSKSSIQFNQPSGVCTVEQHKFSATKIKWTFVVVRT